MTWYTREAYCRYTYKQSLAKDVSKLGKFLKSKWSTNQQKLYQKETRIKKIWQIVINYKH